MLTSGRHPLDHNLQPHVILQGGGASASGPGGQNAAQPLDCSCRAKIVGGAQEDNILHSPCTGDGEHPAQGPCPYSALPCRWPNPKANVSGELHGGMGFVAQCYASKHVVAPGDPPIGALIGVGGEPVQPGLESGKCIDGIRFQQPEPVFVAAGAPFPVCFRLCSMQAGCWSNQMMHGIYARSPGR